VLQLLLEHPQEVVTREELRQRLWPDDRFVDYDLALKRIIAAYWYSRAGKPVCQESLDSEWLSIVKELLG
jgi:hypothetical protein